MACVPGALRPMDCERCPSPRCRPSQSWWRRTARGGRPAAEGSFPLAGVHFFQVRFEVAPERAVARIAHQEIVAPVEPERPGTVNHINDFPRLDEALLTQRIPPV